MSSTVYVVLYCVALTACSQCTCSQLEAWSESYEKENQTAKVLEEVLLDLRHLKDENKRYRVDIQFLKDENQKNKAEMQNFKDFVEKSTQAENVAFFAMMNNISYHPNRGDIIPFSETSLNIGLHYSTDTSIFTCPIHGLYFFSYSLDSSAIGGSEGYDQVTGTLMISGVKVSEIFSYTRDYTDFVALHSSSTAIVECQAGDMVWVECRYNGANTMYGFGQDQPRTTFTGYALTYLHNLQKS